MRGGGGVRHDDSAAARHRGAVTGVSNEEVGSDKAPPAQSLDGEFRAAGMPACDAMTDDGDSEDSGVFVFRGIDGDETESAGVGFWSPPKRTLHPKRHNTLATASPLFLLINGMQCLVI